MKKSGMSHKKQVVKICHNLERKTRFVSGEAADPCILTGLRVELATFKRQMSHKKRQVVKTCLNLERKTRFVSGEAADPHLLAWVWVELATFKRQMSHKKRQAIKTCHNLERKTRFELATFALARQRSTTEPLPHQLLL